MKLKELFLRILYFIVDFDWWLYKPEYTIDGHKVEIHGNDKDIWPSYPHLHIIDDSIKVDIYTGDMYRIYTKKLINKATDKDMRKIWNDKKMLKIILDSRKNKPINVKELSELPFNWIDEENIEWINNYD